ncbi:squalene synthase HpnC [Roseomonas elaeocarpi]|uniref:Squalene synthase HpnC n=1 Tax=Roseomonas elaeocarpi TaxID=907779 RepID=A0ABV6JR94_9PROT
MSGAAELASGKGHEDENFPVASRLVSARHRAPIMAFYRFARAADDVADHASALPEDKFAQLDALERGLRGDRAAATEGWALHLVLRERGLTEQHGHDLLTAFRQDVTKRRYRDWEDLLRYCRYSATPVGRFVLDVHGESPAIWPMNDALCDALQVINHLQDCAKDYRALDRVYIPEDALTEAGIGVESLAAERASPALRGVIAGLARRTAGLLDRSRPFSRGIDDLRLALEVAVIQRLAESLNGRLLVRDPLRDRVHHRKGEALSLAMLAALSALPGRLGRRKTGAALAAGTRG